MRAFCAPVASSLADQFAATGKSTLVDLLAGRRKSGRSSGTVELVFPIGESDRKVKIGYVDQNDVLPGTSTVKEALTFAANLKLPEGMSKAAKECAQAAFVLILS